MWHPRLAGGSATHVVLAGDEALLKAQEGDVADEGVPHGGAARGFTSRGAPSWALNGLERGSHCCCGPAGDRRGQKGPERASFFQFLGLTRHPQRASGQPHAHMRARTCLPSSSPWPTRPICHPCLVAPSPTTGLSAAPP